MNLKVENKYSSLNEMLNDYFENSINDILMINEENNNLEYESFQHSYSCKNLLKKIYNTIGILKAKNISSGDYVIMQMAHKKNYFVSLLALIYMRAVPIILPICSNENKMCELLKIKENNPDAKIICDEEGSRFIELLKKERKLSVNIINEDDFDSEFIPCDLKTGTQNDSDIAMIVYSSGSTSDPKGVILTHKGILSALERRSYELNINSNDVFMTWMPLEHIIGLIDFTLLPIYNKCRSIYYGISSFLANPQEWFNTLEKYKVTITAAPNFAFKYVADSINRDDFWDLSSVRIILNGGEPISKKIIGQFLEFTEKFHITSQNIVPIYGLTESTGFVVFNQNGVLSYELNTEKEIKSSLTDYDIKNFEYIKDDLICQGSVLGGNEVRIVDDEFNLLPDYTIGNIQIKGNSICLGYLNNCNNNLFYDKWLNSGDIGFIADNLLYVIGRKKDVVFSYGKNIYLRDIEYAVTKLYNARSAVCGENIASLGEAYIYLFVEIDLANKDKEHEKQRMKQKILRETGVKIQDIIFQKKLNMTESGKISKVELLRDYKERNKFKNEKEKSFNKHSIIDFLQEISNKSILLSTPIFEIMDDSLKMFQYIGLINKKYQTDIKMSHLIESETIEDLIKCIEKSMNYNNSVIELDIRKPVPDLTLIQEAYILGRQQEFYGKNNMSHFYIEIIHNMDLMKVKQCINKIINYNELLRTVFIDNIPKVLDKNDIGEYEIKTINISKDEEEDYLENNRKKSQELVNDPSIWPLFDIKNICIGNEKNIIVLDIDMLIVDGFSLRILFNEFTKLYSGDTLSEPITNFKEYLNYLGESMNSPKYISDKEFWNNKISSMPEAPRLPIVSSKVDSSNLYGREQIVFNSEQWKMIENFAKKSGVTVSVLLFYLYVKTVGRWSEETDFTINVTVYDRPASIEGLDKVVGDFTTNILFDYINSECKSLNIEEKLQYIRDKMYLYFDHNSFSGVEVIREISKNQKTGSNGLMPVVFTSMLFDEKLDFDCSNINYSRTQTSQVSLDNQIYKLNNKYAIVWDYLEKVYPAKTIHHMFQYYCDLIKAVIDDKDLDSVIIKDEKLVEDYNDTNVEINLLTLDRMLEDVFQKNSTTIAIKDLEQTITYDELNKVSNYLVADFQKRGIKKKDYVIVLTNKDIASIITIIALARLGAVFIPVPESYPEERVLYIKENSGSKYILNAKEICSNLVPKQPEKTDLYCELNDAAYVIYTSGSTGNPKGVEISHEGVFNTLIDINNKFNVGKNDTILGISSLNFDLSIYDIFGTLLAGACLAIVKDQRDSEEIIEVFKNNNITIWNSVPAIMELFLESLNGDFKNDTLRHVLLSGDWINIDLPERIQEVFTNSMTISLGGATEGSIWSIHYPIKKVNHSWNSIPYGYPLDNQKIYILNKKLEICPIGVAGEIFIGGIGVAKRYTANIEKTKESFVDTLKYGRIYRTGDYGKLSEEGYVIFLGRRDSQVKLNGFRVELGEIENTLKKIEGVRDVVVIADENKRLIAYYTSNVVFDEGFMKDTLKKFLPNYMIPYRLLHMEKFSLTSNGKMDYKSLPKVKVNENVINEVPVDYIEEGLLEIWKECLNNTAVGLKDDFFYLGGDSITAQRIGLKILKKFNVKVPFVDIINNGTIKNFSEFVRKNLNGDVNEEIKEEESMSIEEKSKESIALENENEDILNLKHQVVNKNKSIEENYKEDCTDEYPLTGIQLAYLNGRNGSFELGKYNAHYYFEVEFSYKEEDLQNAVNSVIRRHDALRSIFLPNGTQKILKDVPEYIVEAIDSENEIDFKNKNMKVRDELSHKNYEHDKWPMFTFKIIRNNNEKKILCVSIDLMICDGDSLRIFLNELSSGVKGQKFGPLKYTYSNYLKDLSSIELKENYEEDKKYWNDKIDELPDFPQLPMIQKIALCKDYTIERKKAVINYDEWQSFKRVSKNKRISPSALLCSIYGLIVSKWSNQKDLLLNVTVFERIMFNAEVEKIIGDFTKLIPLKINIEDKNIWNIASNTQNEILNNLEHKEYDGTEIVRELSRKRGTIGKALMPVVFTCILFDSPENWFEQLGKVQYAVSQTPQVFLDNQIVEMEQQLQISWDYVKELFDPQVIEEIFNEFVFAIRQIAKTEEVKLVSSSLSENVWNEYNKEPEEAELCTMQDLFEEGAAKFPNNTALVYEENQYTYKFIEEKANQLARYLCSMGICGSNSKVGVLALRKPETIISIIGIMKTGAAYVPIDPKFPKERQEFILKDSDCKTLLSDDIYKTGLLDNFDKTPIGIKSMPDSVAYIVYTSGSTGVPKGVVISHKAVCNTIKDINNKINLSQEDCLIGISSVCFDLSVYDIFGAFNVGASLVIVKEPRDCSEIVNLLRDNKVTIWNSVPILYSMLTKHIKDNGIKHEFKIRQTMLSGDWIPMELPHISKEVFREAKFMSLGGATEGSIWSIHYEVNEVDEKWNSIPYGRPLKNQTMLILDYNLELCPPGVKGDIYIGGVGVANGYNNNEKKTKESFVDHPKLGKIYKTGDLGVLHNEGFIEFIGRKDNQVKIRGYRIELDEIEFVLNQISEIKTAIVTAITGVNNMKQIAAYYISSSNEDLDINSIKSYMTKYLPDYMVPQYFIRLESLPLTHNGKINRKELPLPVLQSDNKEKSQEAKTKTEKSLIDIWKKIFALEQIGIKDDFYSLGGDSIILMQIIDEISSNLDINISIDDVLENDTVEKMAKLIDSNNLICV